MVLKIENEEFYNGKYYNSKINHKFRVRCSVHKEETIKQKKYWNWFWKKENIKNNGGHWTICWLVMDNLVQVYYSYASVSLTVNDIILEY